MVSVVFLFDDGLSPRLLRHSLAVSTELASSPYQNEVESLKEETLMILAEWMEGICNKGLCEWVKRRCAVFDPVTPIAVRIIPVGFGGGHKKGMPIMEGNRSPTYRKTGVL